MTFPRFLAIGMATIIGWCHVAYAATDTDSELEALRAQVKTLTEVVAKLSAAVEAESAAEPQVPAEFVDKAVAEYHEHRANIATGHVNALIRQIERWSRRDQVPDADRLEEILFRSQPPLPSAPSKNRREDRAGVHSYYAMLCERWDRPELAAEHLDRCIEQLAGSEETMKDQIRALQDRLVDALKIAGESERLVEESRAYLEAVRERYGLESRNAYRAEDMLREALDAVGRCEETKEMWERALARARNNTRARKQNPLFMVPMETDYVQYLRQCGRLDEAEALVRRMLDREGVDGFGKDSTLRIELAWILRLKGDTEKANRALGQLVRDIEFFRQVDMNISPSLYGPFLIDIGEHETAERLLLGEWVPERGPDGRLMPFPGVVARQLVALYSAMQRPEKVEYWTAIIERPSEQTADPGQADG